jgi:hypothetical protein
LYDRLADKLANLDQLNQLDGEVTLLFRDVLRAHIRNWQFAAALLRRGADVPLGFEFPGERGHPTPLLAALAIYRLSALPAEKEEITELFEEVLRRVTDVLDQYINASYTNQHGRVITVLDEVLQIPEWAHIAEELRSQGAVTGEEHMRMEQAKQARRIREEAERARQEAEEVRQTKRALTDFSREVDSESKRIELLAALRRTKAAGGKRVSLREGGDSPGFTALHMTSMAPGTPSDDIFLVYGLPPTEEHTVVAEIRVKKGLTADTTAADLEIALKGPAVAEAAAGGAGHGRRKLRTNKRSRISRTSRTSRRSRTNRTRRRNKKS